MQPRQPDINVFALRNSTLLTPYANILEGITRETIFALAGVGDWPVPEALLPTVVDELGERPGPAAVTVGPDAGAKACYLGTRTASPSSCSNGAGAGHPIGDCEVVLKITKVEAIPVSYPEPNDFVGPVKKTG